MKVFFSWWTRINQNKVSVNYVNTLELWPYDTYTSQFQSNQPSITLMRKNPKIGLMCFVMHYIFGWLVGEKISNEIKSKIFTFGEIKTST